MDHFELMTHPHPTPPARRKELTQNPRFGSTFTDHMATIRWDAEHGWHDGRIEALGPVTLHPGSAVLHYGQQIFEGLKAYRAADEGALLFRPLENARRLQQSAARLAMACPPEEIFLEAVSGLVSVDAGWIPEGDGSLYIRPFIIADETFLGVRPANRYLFCVIASPAGSYFKDGARPIRVWVTDTFSRAGRGGTGAAKCGGNYAASLVAQTEATRNECDQVVFLDAAESRWVEELGGMNIFFVMHDGELVTPPLGTILPGITRDAVLTLARDDGRKVSERPYSYDDWRSDASSGRLQETFVCGTAATIVAVGEVRSDAGDFTIGNGECGPVTLGLQEHLQKLQRGQVEDPYGWRHRVDLAMHR